ncbi:MAG: MotA/TolQ/ExbB proton channel family protein, partial [Pseudomonas sp.]|nr:MotA/TolQ/ExbB proton channel family protein [Pseudomonas sp.]
MKHLLVGLSLALLAPMSLAQPANLDDLLRNIRDVRSSEQSAMQERESRFIAERDQQQRRMREAEQALAPVKAEADRLKAEFDRLETALAEVEAELEQRSGNLGELFGVVRQTAGDTQSQWQDSLLNMQFPERMQTLESLSASRGIPTVEALENF